MSTYNLYGGTPKKTLDLMKHLGPQSTLYVYEDAFPELKTKFEATGGTIYEGFYGRNIIKHLRALISIVDQENIGIVQTQFSMGELLGSFLKILRPKVKLIVAFVGPFKPIYIKRVVVNILYRKVDSFVFITEYVKKEKIKQFPFITRKKGTIIFNGTQKRLDNGNEVLEMKQFSIFDIAGLVHWKNIQVLIEAFNIIINTKHRNDVYLYIAGDGPKRKELESLISQYSLDNYIYLLGYQSNIGRLLNNCDVFVHPSYAEGFGIVIPEAMFAKKPIIVSNAGALPELIEHEESGLIVNPYDADQWAAAIMKIIDNPTYANKLAKNAKDKAKKDFSIKNFTTNYTKLYKSLSTNN